MRLQKPKLMKGIAIRTDEPRARFTFISAGVTSYSLWIPLLLHGIIKTADTEGFGTIHYMVEKSVAYGTFGRLRVWESSTKGNETQIPTYG